MSGFFSLRNLTLGDIKRSAQSSVEAIATQLGFDPVEIGKLAQAGGSLTNSTTSVRAALALVSEPLSPNIHNTHRRKL